MLIVTTRLQLAILESLCPGLVIIPSEDPFLSAASATKAAARASAKTAALDGLGHWWMLQDPARAAAVLREFWATLA